MKCIRSIFAIIITPALPVLVLAALAAFVPPASAMTECSNQGEVVSIDYTNSSSNNSSSGLTIVLSRDGRYALFCSHATDLVDPEEQSFLVPTSPNLFLRDRAEQRTEMVIRGNANDAPNKGFQCDLADMSADGQRVLFASEASNLVPGDDNSHYDVFLYEPAIHRTRLVSQSWTGGLGNGDSGQEPYKSISISPNGKWALFPSRATNLVKREVDSDHLYRANLDRVAGGQDPKIELVTEPYNFLETHSGGFDFAVIQDDGTVVFMSSSSKLVQGVAPSHPRIFVAPPDGAAIQAPNHLAEFYAFQDLDVANGWMVFMAYQPTAPNQLIAARLVESYVPGDTNAAVVVSGNNVKGVQISKSGHVTYSDERNQVIGFYRQGICFIQGTCTAAPPEEYMGPGAQRGAISADGNTVAFRWEGNTGVPFPGHSHDIVAIDRDSTEYCQLRILDPNAPTTNHPLIDRYSPSLVIRDPERISEEYSSQPTEAAADGETRLILFWEAPGPGSVDFWIDDENGNTEGLGTVGPLYLDQPYMTSTSVSVQPTVSGNYVAAALYWVPQRFVHDVSPDSDLESRPVRVHMHYTPTGSSAGIDQVKTLDLVRPPLFFLHGIWSDGSTWMWDLQHDSRFTTLPPISYPNDLHYAENVPVVGEAIKRDLETYRRRGMAVTQLSVIAHSMGGQLLRRYASSYQSSITYRRLDNLLAGDVDTFISVDSPHLGSPLADTALLLTDGPSPKTNAVLSRIFCGFHKCADRGAVADLSPTSRETLFAPPSEIPVHYMAGTGGRVYVGNKRVLWFFLDFNLPLILDNIFPDEEHDLLVGEDSQVAGEGYLSPFVSEWPYVDDERTGIHTDNTSEARYSDAALQLLNESPEDFAFNFKEGIPGGPGRAAWIVSPRSLAPRAQADVAGPELVISSPTAGAVFEPGDSIPITVEETSASFVASRLLIACGESVFVITSPPYAATCEAPYDHLGTLPINAIAYDANEVFGAADEVSVQVATSSQVQSIRPLQGSFLLAPGESADLRVLARYDDGYEREIPDSDPGVVLSEGDPAIIEYTGRTVTALAEGATYVRIGYLGHYTSVTFWVEEQDNLSPEVSITEPSGSASIIEGQALTFTAEASDPEDGDLSGVVSWTSDLDGVFGTGGSVTTTSLSAGDHTITASVTDQLGATASDEVPVSVAPNSAPVVVILTPADATTVLDTDTVSFSGTASDEEDGDLTPLLQWRSDRDGTIGSGGAFTTSLSFGTHTIVAEAADTVGRIGSASIGIEVTCTAQAEVALSSIQVADAQSYRACNTLRAGPDVVVTGTGELHLCAGDAVILNNGFVVESGGSLGIGTVCIAP